MIQSLRVKDEMDDAEANNGPVGAGEGDGEDAIDDAGEVIKAVVAYLLLCDIRYICSIRICVDDGWS